MKIKLDARVRMDRAAARRLLAAQTEAFGLTAVDILADLRVSETLPYRSGLLDASTGVLTGDEPKKVQIASWAWYAAMIYNRTDRKYFRVWNQNAGPLWFAPYITGEKKALWLELYKNRLKRGLAKKQRGGGL